VVPSLLFVFFGQEFPTILGSVFGLIVIVISVKLGFLVPKEILSLSEKREEEKLSMSPYKAFLPYIILLSLLIIGKIIFENIGISLFLGFKHVFNVFNPGFFFIISGLLVVFIWKEKFEVILNSIKKALNGAIHPFFIVFLMLAMVQIIVNSGNNYSGILSAISLMTKSFETVLLPLFAPFIGAFGSFMTGSVTVSNIMFGHLFNIAATNLSMDTSIILSLGVVGAAAGNMIALADILTAEAVTGTKNGEVGVIKGVIIPCLIYLSIVGIIGIIVLR
jgi:lactate permease